MQEHLLLGGSSFFGDSSFGVDDGLGFDGFFDTISADGASGLAVVNNIVDVFNVDLGSGGASGELLAGAETLFLPQSAVLFFDIDARFLVTTFFARLFTVGVNEIVKGGSTAETVDSPSSARGFLVLTFMNTLFMFFFCGPFHW